MRAEYITHMGDDNMAVDAARVSLDKQHNQYTQEANAKLIRYLADNAHWTPFAHPQIQLRITAPLFVARQWFRSTVGVARNEVSRRYVDGDLEFYVPHEWRSRPDGSIKQGSGAALNPAAQKFCDGAHETLIEHAEFVYNQLLREDVAPEQARMVLPQSMETQWIETGSLAYFARIVKQRIDNHAQQETQDLAFQIHQIIQPLFPVSWGVLMEEEAYQ